MSPPGGWKISFFFTKKLHKVQLFCEKEKSTMLPQAKSAFSLGTRLKQAAPRQS
jgi:hypothetical protein